jgi:hypothetical protein
MRKITLSLAGPIVIVIACSAPADENVGTDSPALAVTCTAVPVGAPPPPNCPGGGGGGGTPPPPPTTPPPPPQPPHEPPVKCSGLPKIDSKNFDIQYEGKSKERACPNGTKAFVSWALSAHAEGHVDPNKCLAEGSFNGHLAVTPQLCGRFGGSVDLGVSGKGELCMTPDCPPGGVAICKGPACAAEQAAFDAKANLHATWALGDILPPARAVSSFIDGSITLDIDGQGHADRSLSQGSGWCGCCANGKQQDVVLLTGRLDGKVTGKLRVDLGWIGNAELTAQGTGCIAGKKRWGETCEGHVDELTGGWQLTASVSGRGCIGSGWFEYCREFSGGPWTAGPGCEL